VFADSLPNVTDAGSADTLVAMLRSREEFQAILKPIGGERPCFEGNPQHSVPEGDEARILQPGSH
jgi:hypothetical protein